MNKDEILNDIFEDDTTGLLTVKPVNSNNKTPDERLVTSFIEINEFVTLKGKEPEQNPTNILEFQLYSRLKNLRKDDAKIKLLKKHDIHNLLPILESNKVNEPQAKYSKPKVINSIDDLLDDDSMDILGGDSEGLFDFKHTPKDYERANADYIARRKPCKDFDKYENLFKEIQTDLANGKRKLVEFKEDNLFEGEYYVHNGLLLLLEKINISQEEQSFASGKRTRKDGRTRCIFENGTESNMLYRSLAKILYANGRIVTHNIDKVNEEFSVSFSDITDKDEAAGYIYVLKSKSDDKRITSIQNLFKIGFSKITIEERIKNAEKEPTYLMAPVLIKSAWKCYNMNPQKLEQLLHNFFGNSCLEIDVFDENGKRHTPREWFIAPIEVIEQAIVLIINGKIINYRFDADNLAIVKR